MKKKLLLLMAVACSLNMQAQFSGKGMGTEADPYQITNADQLFDVRNDLTASYIVMNDLDIEAWIKEDNPNQGWNPIGTTSSPFQGVFNGNNKVIKGLFINRESMDNQGLFGVTHGATIQSVCLLNPMIKGKSNVGPIAGTLGVETNELKFKDNCVIGGTIYGETYVGGVIGQAYSTEGGANYYIEGNYSSAFVKGVTGVGGICGHIDIVRYYWGRFAYGNIQYNSFRGVINGTTQVGGIIGVVTDRYESGGSNVQYSVIGNTVGGTILGNTAVNGIMGQGVYYDKQNITISKNVCYADTITSSEMPYRISAVAGTDNYGYTGTVLIANKKTTIAEDNAFNGTSVGLKTLKRQNTYVGLGYDFSSQWAIVEGETMPYNIHQSTPGKVNSFLSGSRAKISGTAEKNGTVYVFVDGQVYESFIVDGRWELTLGSVATGTRASVSVATLGLMPSIFIEANSTDAPEPPTTVAGDANGDGVVDTADVTAIINFILGKPSASFNKENADVNGDGNILIDDAVSTVQLIMNAQ